MYLDKEAVVYIVMQSSIENRSMERKTKHETIFYRTELDRGNKNLIRVLGSLTGQQRKIHVSPNRAATARKVSHKRKR